MKKGIFYLGILLCLVACSSDADSDEPQQSMTMIEEEGVNPNLVLIPDEAFEQALIDLNYDDILDGTILKERVDFVAELQLVDKGINDLTGITAFEQLKNLNVRENELTDLNVSSNTSLLFLWVEDNMLESLDVTGLSLLEKIGADRNVLNQLDVRANQALQFLTLSENELDAIDVSNNPALTDFNIIGNPLSCILVSQSQFDAVPTDWTKDDMDSYALDCE